MSSLKIYDLQFANPMSAAHKQAATRDKHGKVNGQLPVQILGFSLNVQLQSPSSLNSKSNLILLPPIFHEASAFVQRLAQKELKSEVILREHPRALGKSKMVGVTCFSATYHCQDSPSSSTSVKQETTGEGPEEGCKSC